MTTVRAFVALTFNLGTGVTLHASLESFAQAVHLEAVGEEELVAPGTLKGRLHVVHLSALTCSCLYTPTLVLSNTGTSRHFSMTINRNPAITDSSSRTLVTILLCMLDGHLSAGWPGDAFYMRHASPRRGGLCNHHTLSRQNESSGRGNIRPIFFHSDRMGAAH